MKYVLKWNNGYWKVFDQVSYSDVMLCNLKSEAEIQCKRLNSQEKRKA